MGREIKRVPLDFDWPRDKPWKGFLNPHGGPCPAEAKGECFNGVTAGRRYIGAIAQLIAVVGDDARGERKNGIWPHPYIQELPMAPRHRGRAVGPTPEAVAFSTALAGRGPSFLGHDACACWSIEKKLIEAAGLDGKTWGMCPVCDGHGDDPTQRDAAEAWKREEPPKGDGWQLWETVSEGSPISPVFPTRETFIDYLVGEGYSRNAAERFSESGWAPSMVMGPDGIKNDIESCAEPRS